jgi:uncharacterized membrane protein
VAGSVAAGLFVARLGVVLHRLLRRPPESELKCAVGLVLTTFGTFFFAEGLGVDWPLGDASLLIVLAFGWGSRRRRRACSRAAAAARAPGRAAA